MANTAKVISVAKDAKSGWAATEGNRGVMYLAIFLDILSIIPYVGLAIAFFAYPTIWLMLKNRGIDAGLFNRGASKKIASVASEIILGVFGFSFVPGISAWAYFAITGGAEDSNGEENVSVTHHIPENTSRARTSSYS